MELQGGAASKSAEKSADSLPIKRVFKKTHGVSNDGGADNFKKTGGFNPKEGFKRNGNNHGGLRKNDRFNKSVPKGKKPMMAKFSKKTDPHVEKKKGFKKPKHLKRKLAQTEDETDKEKLLEEIQTLDERKKLFSVNKPSKKQKTKPTTRESNDSALETALKKNANLKKTNIVKQKPVKKPVVSENEGIRPPEPIPEDEPDVVSENEEVEEVDVVIPTKATSQEKAPVSSQTGSDNKKEERTDELDTKGEDSDDDKGSGDSSDSDSDSDDEIQPAKRVRGRGRKGRQDTDKHVEETKQEEKKQERKPRDLSRRCIGRKPLTDYLVGQSHSGKVVYIKPFGVFIDINCHSEAFCHVSRLQDGFVKTPEDVVSVGDVVSARIVEVDRKQKRITVSLQSEQRLVDEQASAEAKQLRNTRRERKLRSKPPGGSDANELVRSPAPRQDKQVEPQPAPEPDATVTNDLVDADGNYLKDESQMTPAELKRARKLQRRALRRAQQ